MRSRQFSHEKVLCFSFPNFFLSFLRLSVHLWELDAPQTEKQDFSFVPCDPHSPFLYWGTKRNTDTKIFEVGQQNSSQLSWIGELVSQPISLLMHKYLSKPFHAIGSKAECCCAISVIVPDINMLQKSAVPHYGALHCIHSQRLLVVP